MSLDQGAREIDVAGQNGVANLEVLVAPSPVGLEGIQSVIATRLVEQLAAEMQRPGRAAGRHQRIVIALVPPPPFLPHTHGIIRPRPCQLRQEEIRTDDLRLPGFGAMADRVGQCPRLQVDAQFGEIEEFPERYRRGAKAAACLGPGKPLGHEMRQGLAQRPDGRAVALTQRAELQLLIRSQHAAQDVLAHPAQCVEGGTVLPAGVLRRRGRWRPHAQAVLIQTALVLRYSSRCCRPDSRP